MPTMIVVNGIRYRPEDAPKAPPEPEPEVKAKTPANKSRTPANKKA